MSIRIKINNVRYKSLSECCEKLHVSYSLVSTYIRTGCTPEEAVYLASKGKTKKRKAEKCTYNGVEYNSLFACCEDLGLDSPIVSQYRKRVGCSADEAVRHFVALKDAPSRKLKPVLYNGIKYESITECCRQQGLPCSTVREVKRRKKCTYAEAVQYCVERKAAGYMQRLPFSYNGTTYNSLNACCRALGISPTSVAGYQKRTGLPVEAAVTYYVARKQTRDSATQS